MYRRDRRLLAGRSRSPRSIPSFPAAGDRRRLDDPGRLAERWWSRERRAFFELSYPNALNVLNIPAFGYALAAAYPRRPVRAALAGAASMGLKFRFVGALVRRYDAASG